MSAISHGISAVLGSIALIALAGRGICADFATDAVQLQLLQREQQQDELRLRLEQDRLATQPPTLDLQRPQEFQQFERAQREQQLRLDQQRFEQQELHLNQQLRLNTQAGRETQIPAEQQRFAEERQQQLQRFEWERQQLRQNYPSPSTRLPGLR